MVFLPPGPDPANSDSPARMIPGADVPSMPRQAVLNACRSGAWEKVGGITPVARFLYYLENMGMEEVILLVPHSRRGDPAIKMRRGPMRLTEVRVSGGGAFAPEALLFLRNLESRFLYIDAAHIVDPRILRVLASSRKPALAFMNPDDEKNGTIRAGLLLREDLPARRKEGSGSPVHERYAAVLPEDLDPFSPELRGPLIPYFMEIRDGKDARDATRLLIRCQQKHVMDLPAEYIDPFFENRLTYLLCNTSVTPNMVTCMGIVVTIVTAWFFLNAHFVAGALLMFCIEILDGVDGKLARTKLQYSRFGRHEDVVDYFCETGLYLAIGAGLASVAPGSGAPFLFTALMIVSDTVDNVLYTLAGKWHGKSIDLFSPFDGAFRRIGGRRNIYGMMFIAGFSAGYPLYTFAVAAVWAAITAIVHGVRLARYGMKAVKKP